MFFPVLGITAAAVGLIQLGALTVKVVLLKAMLAVTAAVTLLLALSHVWRWRKDSRNADPS